MFAQPVGMPMVGEIQSWVGDKLLADVERGSSSLEYKNASLKKVRYHSDLDKTGTGREGES